MPRGACAHRSTVGRDTRRVKQFGGRPYTSSHLSEEARRGRRHRLLIDQNFSRSLNEAKHAKSIGLEPREIRTPPQKNRAVDKNPLARPRPTPYIAPTTDEFPRRDGALAQLGERLHGMQEVRGSIPLGSTKSP